MPDNRIVINTGPLLALVAGCGDLEILDKLYHEIIVPFEVCKEIMAGDESRFAIPEFKAATWLNKLTKSTKIPPILKNALDSGEASVIQTATEYNINLVCIDEAMGRRVARLSNLKVTGSVGILIRAKREGWLPSVKAAIKRMVENGVWLNPEIIQIALRESGEL